MNNQTPIECLNKVICLIEAPHWNSERKTSILNWTKAAKGHLEKRQETVSILIDGIQVKASWFTISKGKVQWISEEGKQEIYLRDITEIQVIN